MKQPMFSLDNIISITDLRQDIDSLTKRLAKYPFTVIFKNKDPLFIAVKPSWFKKKVLGKEKTGPVLAQRQKAAAYFRRVAQGVGNWQATKVVIQMREKEKKQWTR